MVPHVLARAAESLRDSHFYVLSEGAKCNVCLQHACVMLPCFANTSMDYLAVRTPSGGSSGTEVSAWPAEVEQSEADRDARLCATEVLAHTNLTSSHSALPPNSDAWAWP